MPDNHPKPLGGFTESDRQRFRKYLPEDLSPDECWPWKGNRHSRGYGIFWHKKRKPLGAHRVAFMLYRLIDPGDRCICHSCDNPPCCNPGHLFLGTHGDNMRDRDKKGRNVNHRGEAHRGSKLSADQVRTIRRIFTLGFTKTAIASRFGIDRTTVAQIISRKTWRHI